MTAAKSTPMTFVCPGCGSYGTPELFSSDADARYVCSLLAQQSAELGPLLMAYLRLWTPRKRALTWRRARQLLEELLPQIEAGQIRRKGRNWPAPASAWSAAIKTMLDNRSIELPLTSHGYLLSVIAGDADKAEAQRERETEAGRAAGQIRTFEDEAEAERQFKLNVRNAKAFITTERTIARKRFQEEYSADQARDFLKGRRYGFDVIEAAIAEIYNTESSDGPPKAGPCAGTPGYAGNQPKD